jgi:hypothetical protein
MFAKLYVVQSIAAATMWKQGVDKGNENGKDTWAAAAKYIYPKGVLDRLGHRLTMIIGLVALCA